MRPVSWAAWARAADLVASAAAIAHAAHERLPLPPERRQGVERGDHRESRDRIHGDLPAQLPVAARAAAADVRGRREQSRPRRQQGRRREPKLPMKPVSSVAHTPPAPLVPACSIRKITALMSNPALVLASL